MSDSNLLLHDRWLQTSIRFLLHVLDRNESQTTWNDEAEQLRTDIDACAAEMTIEPPLEIVTRAFGLSEFERALLLLCAGTELSGDLATTCAAIHGIDKHFNPTFSLALAYLPNPHWDAIAPTSPLRRWGLISLGPSSSLSLSRH